jgi:hypothetical protein
MSGLPSFELDHLVAHGVAGDEAGLTRRAARLSTPGSRRRLAKALERLQNEVVRPQRPRCYAPERMNRAEVVRASAELTELIQLLRSDTCDPRAAATASWLLRHPDSPVYLACPLGALADVVRRATNSR